MIRPEWNVGVPMRGNVVARCPECGESYGTESRFCGVDGATLVPGEADPSTTRLLGRVVDGRYAIVSLLGEGGMGSVYKVNHTSLDRQFAMKVLKKGLAEDRKLAERFIREAKATASVKHPHVVGITDFGHLDDGRPYFVMDLLVGQTLAETMRVGGPLEPARAARLLAKVARALGAAHEVGIIHRDIKPENIILVGPGPEYDVKVVDFGAALVIGARRTTKAGVVFGTPHFMSPEQASGNDIDHRADIYSLGVVMYEALTGDVPFDGDVYHEILRQHLLDPPRPPTVTVDATRAAWIRPFEPIVLRALAKEPDGRYLTAEALAQDLERAAQGLPLAAPAPAPAVIVAPRPSPSPRANPPGSAQDPALALAPPLAPARAPAGREDDVDARRRRVIAALVVLLVLARLVTRTRLASSAPPRPPPPPARRRGPEPRSARRAGFRALHEASGAVARGAWTVARPPFRPHDRGEAHLDRRPTETSRSSVTRGPNDAKIRVHPCPNNSSCSSMQTRAARGCWKSA